MSRSRVRDFLDRHQLRAHKDLGQNFLIDDAWAARLAALAGVSAGDSVLEIGTGTGVLTRALAARAARVVTLDVDAGLVRALRAEDDLPDNVELHHADVLKADLESLVAALRPPVRLVSNLPYSISGPALRRLLDLRAVLADWSVMLQQEVARRLVASPGTKDYGSLTVLHALVADVERLADLAPGCFFPEPQVRSSFVRVHPRADATLSHDALRRTERVVRAAFNNRRKTLFNALRAAGFDDADGLRAALERCGVDARVRGETLEPQRFLDLAAALHENRPVEGG